jgi:chaperonin GroES
MKPHDQVKPRLLKSSQQHEFVAAEWTGSNESGYHPLGDMVLIAPDCAAEKTSGGIVLTVETTDRMSMAAESGVVVALGSDAYLWNADRTRRWEGLKPSPGDRIYMQRYSGQLVLGKDGKVYRLCEQNCIGAIEIRECSEEEREITLFENLHNCIHEVAIVVKDGHAAWNDMPAPCIIRDDKGRGYAYRNAVLDCLWRMPVDHPVRFATLDPVKVATFDWGALAKLRKGDQPDLGTIEIREEAAPVINDGPDGKPVDDCARPRVRAFGDGFV